MIGMFAKYLWRLHCVCSHHSQLRWRLRCRLYGLPYITAAADDTCPSYDAGSPAHACACAFSIARHIAGTCSCANACANACAAASACASTRAQASATASACSGPKPIPFVCKAKHQAVLVMILMLGQRE